MAFGPFFLARTTRELARAGAVLRMEPKAFDVLVTLVFERTRVVSREELLERHWSHESVCYGALAQCIWSIRKTLGDSASAPSYIKTLPRRGYRFVAHVVDGPPRHDDIMLGDR